MAEIVKDAQELLNWYKCNIDTQKITWSVAENFRYMDSFDYAQSQVQKLGRVLGFRTKLYANLKSGGKYIGTSVQ